MSVSNPSLNRGESIADLKQANKHLQEAYREITAILESITDGFAHLDAVWRFTYVNRAMETVVGRKREELLGQSLWDVLPEARDSYLENRLCEAMATQQTLHFEARQPRWGRWFEIHVYPAPDGLSVYFHDITARKQAEDALRQSRDAFRLLTEAMPQLVWITDATGCWEYANQQWYEFTESGTEEPPVEDWIVYCHPDDQFKVQTLWRTSLLTSCPFQSEARLRQGKTGAYRWFLVRAVPIRLSSGQIWKWVGTWTDIHDEKGVEEALRESEVRFSHLVQSNIIGITVIDLEGPILEANDAFLSMLGYTRQDLEAGQLNWRALTPPQYQDPSTQAVKEVQTTGVAHLYEKEYLAKNGKHVPVLVGSVVFRRTGSRQLAVSFVVDLTARKAVEKQREEARRQMTELLESITDGVVYLDEQWHYRFLNERMKEIIGKPGQELQGQSIWEAVPELVGTSFEQHYREAMATRQTFHFEARHPTRQRWLDVHVYPAQRGIAVYVRDITERKQAEEALRESEARFRGLVESNLIGITVSDLAGTIREANDAFLDLVGYSREDLAAGRLQWAVLTPPEYQKQHAQMLEELLTTGRVQPVEKEYLTKGGTRVPVLVGRTLFRKDEATPQAITFIVDQTAQKEIERQKDLFLGVTSHELKTPLAALRGMLQLIQRRMKRVVATTDHLSPDMCAFFESLTISVIDSVRQVDIQTRLINDLLDVSRMTARTLKVERSPCDLSSIVRQTVEDLRVTAPDRSLLLDIPEQAPVLVLADRDRISQVITNYVTNALRYSPVEQPVRIGLMREQDEARVWVCDRGPGLSAEAQKELWQRFRQIKGVPAQSGSGKGLGLGLYICQTLVALHQGEVGVESTPGEGSTFWFTLPLLKEE